MTPAPDDHHGATSAAPAPDPLLNRVQAGLAWPQWSRWADNLVEPSDRPEPSVPDSPIDHVERATRIRQRLARARTTADGGPWLTLFRDGLDQRLAAEADEPVGPLAMHAFAVKALCALRGQVTTAGSPVRADAEPERASAPIVRQLERLGAVALGTVTMHEFAFGVTGVNRHAGTAPNPAAPDRVPGGSSSGSASAVADGSADFAIGTDTGGSVRIPSAFCGIAGFKPAHGTYPADGVFPLSTTLDHVGFHAPTVAALAGLHRSLGFATSEVERPLRIGIARSDLDHADDPVREAIEAALAALVAAGATTVDVAWPDPEETFVASTGIMFSEAAAIHAEGLAAHADRYGADIRARLTLGASLTGPEVAAAHRLRGHILRTVRATLADVDVIASPTVPIVAPRLVDADDPALAPRIVANTRLGNVVGLPALTLPAPTPGLPVGLQLLGSTNAHTLAAGAWAEQVLAGSAETPARPEA